MANTVSDDVKVRAFGLAAHLMLESLIDRLIASGTMRPDELQMAFCEALMKCGLHELPASSWQLEAAQARGIIEKSKADALALHGQ